MGSSSHANSKLFYASLSNATYKACKTIEDSKSYTRINNLHTKTSLKCIQLINASEGYRIGHLAVTVLNAASLKYVKVKKFNLKK